MPAGRVSAELDAAAAQREATPGRPQDGPYPATVGEVADEVVAWIDHMSDTFAQHLIVEVLRRMVPAGVSGELATRKEQYVHDQVSRVLAHREGDMSRAQIDDEEAAARMRWDDMYPSCAVLRKILGGGA